jgi:hypothetical protein
MSGSGGMFGGAGAAGDQHPTAGGVTSRNAAAAARDAPGPIALPSLGAADGECELESSGQPRAGWTLRRSRNLAAQACLAPRTAEQ